MFNYKQTKGAILNVYVIYNFYVQIYLLFYYVIRCQEMCQKINILLYECYKLGYNEYTGYNGIFFLGMFKHNEKYETSIINFYHLHQKCV